MAPLTTLLSVEWTKLIRRPMSWILAVILIGFVGLIYVSLIAVLVAPDVEGFDKEEFKSQLLLPDGVNFGLSTAQGIGTILLIVLAAGSYASEFSWATIRTMLVMRAERVRMMVAKFAVLEAVAVVVVVLGAGLGFVGALVAGIATGDSPPTDAWLNSGFFGDLALMMLRAFIATSMWILIASTISVISHSLPVGIGVSLAFYFIGDLITSLLGALGDIGLWISRLAPNQAINALLALNQPEPPSYEAIDWLWISANIIGYAVILTVLAIRQLRRMNMIETSS